MPDAARSIPALPPPPNACAPVAAASFHPVILLPSYNNAAKLPAVLDGVATLGLPLILVNDGSTDGTSEVLGGWTTDHPEANVCGVNHAHNRGKGAALRTGFTLAVSQGYTHAIAIDTDGQHDPSDAPSLLAAAAAEPTALVVGSRNANDPNYPRKSRIGRTWANLTILLSSGRRVEDSQCGYRVYPLGLVSAVRCWSGRYGYEGEILIRSGWAGTPLIEVPIRVIYPPKSERISHYRPWRDSIHTYLVYALLSLRAIVPWPFVKWPPAEKGDRYILSSPPKPTPRRGGLRRLLTWFDPREVIHQVRRDRVSQMAVAAGFGIGVLVANLPVYPVQTLVALYLAKRLHLHPVATVLGSQLAFPPLGFALIAAAITLGRLLLTGSPPTFHDFENFRAMGLGELHVLLRSYFFAWWLGGILLGLVLGWATFLGLLGIFRFIPVEGNQST